MLPDYISFLSMSAGASSGFIGLFFIALSFARQEPSTPFMFERRVILAGGSLLALLDIFVVTLLSLTKETTLFAAACAVMAVVSLAATYELISRAVRGGLFARTTASRRQSQTFAVAAISSYAIQFVLGIALWRDMHATWPIQGMIFVILLLFITALMRIWVVVWIPPVKKP